MIASSLLIPPEKLGTPPMSDSPFSLLPTASNHAAALDNLYIFITVLCAISMVMIVGAQIYFMVKYRQTSPDQKTDPLTHNGKLEFAWSAIPAILLVVIFVWGEIDFMKMSTPPAEAIDVRVTGAKWFWKIEYPEFPGGPSATCPQFAKTCDAEVLTPTLVVPKDVPVRLTMSSQDVIHSFYIPAFRTKKDVVPGRYTNIWFEALDAGQEPQPYWRAPEGWGGKQPEWMNHVIGEYPIFCTEYCGDQHSAMLAKVVVVDSYESYRTAMADITEVKQGDGESTEAFGARLTGVYGCPACHSVDGSKIVGPSFKGLYGKSESMTDGSSVKVDDNYIRESIYDPNAKVVSGYSPQMPSFKGQINEAQLNAIIDYIKSLK